MLVMYQIRTDNVGHHRIGKGTFHCLHYSLNEIEAI